MPLCPHNPEVAGSNPAPATKHSAGQSPGVGHPGALLSPDVHGFVHGIFGAGLTHATSSVLRSDAAAPDDRTPGVCRRGPALACCRPAACVRGRVSLSHCSWARREPGSWFDRPGSSATRTGPRAYRAGLTAGRRDPGTGENVPDRRHSGPGRGNYDAGGCAGCRRFRQPDPPPRARSARVRSSAASFREAAASTSAGRRLISSPQGWANISLLLPSARCPAADARRHADAPARSRPRPLTHSWRPRFLLDRVDPQPAGKRVGGHEATPDTAIVPPQRLLFSRQCEGPRLRVEQPRSSSTHVK